MLQRLFGVSLALSAEQGLTAEERERGRIEMQEAVGELVHYEPPDVGTNVAKDSSYGEVESVKAVSDLISPLSGEVLEVNAKVIDAPETVNDDPYGDGWLIRIRMSNAEERDQLLDVAGYKKMLETQ